MSRILMATFAGMMFAGTAHADKLRLSFDPGPGATADRALVQMKSVTFWGCNNPINIHNVDAPIALDSEWNVDLPSDDFCQVTLRFDSNLVSEGTEGSDDFLAVSPVTQLELVIAPGQTMVAALTGSMVLEGVYGGNPDIVVTRDQ